MEHQFQFLATQEGGVDEQNSHSGFVGAAGRAATAAEMVHMDQNVPIHQAVNWDGVTAQWGMGGLVALRDQFHYSEGTEQEDIQEPKNRERTDICSISKTFFFFWVWR